MNPANHQVYLSGFNNTPIYTMDICEGQLFTSNIVSRDIDASNTTTITVNPFNTNGINFQTTGGHRDSLLIAWTPTQADVASSPNCFTVYVKDDNCPYFSFYQKYLLYQRLCGRNSKLCSSCSLFHSRKSNQ
ncbi:MAG: hypothetical protein IPP51_15445 [Bacteroidetes bacterium]|nr:hypothetical protein [Bacteroidota bacterium]